MPPCKQEISVVEWGAIVKFAEKWNNFTGLAAGFRGSAAEVLWAGGRISGRRGKGFVDCLPDFGMTLKRFYFFRL